MLHLQFDLLYRKYYQQLLGYAISFLPRQEDAEDAIQDTFFIIRDAVAEKRNIKYIMVALKHRCYEKLDSERRKSQSKHGSNQMFGRHRFNMPIGNYDPLSDINISEKYEKDIRTNLLYKIIHDCNDHYPEGFKILHLYLSGMNRQQVLEATGKRPRTCDWQRDKAIDILRQEIKKLNLNKHTI